MQIDYGAMVYAQRTYPIFLRRYVIAAAVGRHYVIPEPIRESVDAIFKGNDAVGPATIHWIYSALYNWRVKTGQERQVPEDCTPADPEGPTALQIAGKVTAITLLGLSAVMAAAR